MNPGRHRDLYFPFATDDLKFYKKTSDMARKIGNKEAAFLEGVRKSNPHVFLELQVLKEVSNSVKHWRLIPTKNAALAISIERIGRPQEIFQIPEGYFDDNDEFMILKSIRPIEPISHFNIVLQIRFDGLPTNLATDPGQIFGNASRIVLQIIQGSEKIAGWPQI